MTKILYVDDIERGGGVLERRLTRKGFDLIRARDGQQAVDSAHREHPDIILIDMTLPVMPAENAIREIKQAEDTKHIPIIALAARATSKDRELALKAGCDDCNTKPMEYPRLLLPRLLEKINRLLQR
ncbi:response regulator [Candidatus Albibeggiatoa sp. nov. NOAA]|uniref:response regulator n=1 Tax=Candidatus Albibeggiatoa sp. nov. NOAA TaxID=3162724 RepID=UPI0032F1D279|nr:response regulator [Thiotrichaceae bacterium]